MKRLVFVLLALLIAGCQEQIVKPELNGPDYKDFIINKDNLKYTIVYEVSTKTINYVMKQYYDGANKVRTDNIINDIEARQYFLNDKVYSCNNQNNEWKCLQLNQEMVNDYIAMFKDIEKEPDKYNPVYTGKKSIANTEAYCFNIKIKSLFINTEQCFSKEGIPLLMKFGSFATIKAKEYKLGVDNIDFSLPAEPEKLQND